MDFLYKLYSYNYFGIGLFIVITVLAFAFLVILFFGKKDEKTRMEQQKLEENQNVMNTDTIIENKNLEEELKTETLETISLPEESAEVLTDETNNVSEEVVWNAPVEEPVVQEIEKPTRNYTADDLDLDFNSDYSDTLEEEILSKREEPESDLDIFNIKPEFDMKENFEDEIVTSQEDYEEQRADVSIEYDFDRQEENNREQRLEENSYDYEEPAPESRRETRKAMPSVFSSVYKNNEREDIFPETTYQQEENYPINLEPEIFELKEDKPSYEEPKEEAVQEVKPITQKKPEFVLPKRADMPRLNKQAENNNDSIIKF